MTYNDITERIKDCVSVQEVSERKGEAGVYIDIKMTDGNVFSIAFADNTSERVHIRWAAAEPTADADVKDTPDKWVGFYVGEEEEAPTDYTAYTWVGADDYRAATVEEINKICV